MLGGSVSRPRSESDEVIDSPTIIEMGHFQRLNSSEAQVFAIFPLSHFSSNFSRGSKKKKTARRTMQKKKSTAPINGIPTATWPICANATREKWEYADRTRPILCQTIYR